MSSYDYDLFTVGAGSGGVRASRVAASRGARVAVAEERYLGGTCVNVGCVPKKLLVYASHFREDFHDAAGFGWTVGELRFDWSRLIANKNAEIQRLNGVYETLLGNSGVEIIDGHARLVDAHTVTVGDKKFTADNILIATGGWPAVPDVPGIEHVITSNEAFFLESLPERIVVVGGGYIAVEFAGIFHGLGARVTQLYRGPLFLRGFDDDVRETLAEEMRKKGVDLRFDAKLSRIDKTNGALTVTLADGSTVEADTVMYATGRLPKVRGLGLEEIGVRFNDKGAIVVDSYSRSTVPHIFAVGDCTDRINLTPVAIKEGQAVAETLYGGRPTRPDHTIVPSAVFSQPPIGSVGLTEAEAGEARPIDVYISRFKPMKHTLTGGEERTMMKIIVDRETDRVLGCHMVGMDAAEIIQGIAIALKCGATKAQFDSTVGIHPTAAEEFVTMRDKRPDP